MKNIYQSLALSATLLVVPTLSSAEEKPLSPSPSGAAAYFISPMNGDVTGESVTVRFGLRGMGVAPAGMMKLHTGHHHLLIDGTELPAKGKAMGSDVKHFGGGQTETTLHLGKGKHTLQLVLGDHHHIPHNPPVVSEKITITVK